MIKIPNTSKMMHQIPSCSMSRPVSFPHSFHELVISVNVWEEQFKGRLKTTLDLLNLLRNFLQVSGWWCQGVCEC